MHKKEYIQYIDGCLSAGGRGVRKREIERISYIIHYRIKRVRPDYGWSHQRSVWIKSTDLGWGGCIIEGGEQNVYYDEVEGVQ